MTTGIRLKLWVAASILAAIAVVAWRSGSREPPGRRSSVVQSSAGSSLARESMDLLRPTLTNVYFGMSQAELQRARPRAKRLAQADEAGFFVFGESLSAEQRVVYGVDQSSLQLVKVQIAGRLHDVAEVAPRIALMQGRYGAPTGVWDCVGVPGQLPTRRFTYQRSALAVMDSYLMLGEQIAVTLYVAPPDLLRQSLTVAGCKATPQDRWSKFPTVALPSPSP